MRTYTVVLAHVKVALKEEYMRFSMKALEQVNVCL